MPTTRSIFLAALAILLTTEVALAQVDPPSTTHDPDSCALELDVLPKAPASSLVSTGGPVSSAELTNPSIGFGLDGITDYSPQQPFIDIMKAARPWLGHTNTEWGAWEHTELAAGGYLDDEGWLKAIPPSVVAVESLLLTAMPAEAEWIKGRYRLTYEGSGDIKVTSMLQQWSGEKGEIWFETTPGEAQASVVIMKTDPAGTGDYIRNISIVKEENVPAFEAGEIFNPLWLKHIRDARLVRFMDWMRTNNSTQSAWGERPKPSDYTYSLRGAPLELMVRLANDIGADPWFTLPHLATDHYMRCFAQGVHQLLRKDLKAHVELSNEVWNWGFGQAEWAENGGVARWGESDRGVQYYAVRARDMALIWDDVYGSDAADQLVKVIATQTGWTGLESDILAPPLWKAENPAENIDIARYFDAYAVTGYFGYGLGDSKAPQVRQWIADSLQSARGKSVAMGLSGKEQAAFIEQHRFDEAIEIAAQDLRDGRVTGEKSGSLADFLQNILPYQAGIAQSHDLDLIMYEGGTHVVGIGAVADDEEVTAFFLALNYSEQMGELYQDLMEGWKDAGGTVFNVFVDVSGPSRWGSWGALRHLNDDNPRWAAIAAFNKAEPGWWEERLDGSFLPQQ